MPRFDVQTICVLGLGYIGLPTAAMFATHGKRVVGVDVNPRVLDTLRNGGIHIEEPGLAAFVQAALSSGRLSLSMKPVEADAFIIAVPTPHFADHTPDLRYVHQAAADIVPFLRPGNLVILESTSPPGTTRGLRELFESFGIDTEHDVLVAHSPERVLPGKILTELVQNDRVIGGETPAAADAVANLYRTFVKGEILLTDATTAELVKLMENTFRDVNIALANEFSRVAGRLGIDVHEAITLANHHPRVNVLKPGPGVGGHCIAVDPWFIIASAPDETPLMRTARAVNDSQPDYVVELVASALEGVLDPTVAVLGLAYKADVDDLRESPAMDVVARLRRAGYAVRLHDAHATELPDGTPLETDLASVLRGTDALLVLTDHAAYRRLHPEDREPAGMRRRIAIDTRNCLDARLWSEAGFAVHRLGATPVRSAVAVR